MVRKVTDTRSTNTAHEQLGGNTMKRGNYITYILAIVCTALAVFIGASGRHTQELLAAPEGVKDGWQLSSQFTGWRYVTDGQYVTGWQHITPRFALVLDAALKEESLWLPEGPYPVDGYGRTYYFDERGRLAVGWQQIKGAWHYFATDLEHIGEEQVDWFEVDGQHYYGVAQQGIQTGWATISDKRYYFVPITAHPNDPQQIIGGHRATAWQWIDGQWYYFSMSNGVMATGWQQTDLGWYYLNDAGVMQTGWQHVNGRAYYLETNGLMQTNWRHIQNKWYFFRENGERATGWIQLGTTWYYLDSDGVMQTGWVLLQDRWYYLQEHGAMLTGTHWLGQQQYHFAENGVWQP